MKQRITLVVIVFILLVITAIASSMIFDWNNNSNKQIIGGETDKNGCLISAGYTYDEGIGACTRSWEIKESTDKMAAKIAVESIDETNQPSLTIENVNPVGCEGCFVVSLNYEDNKKELIYLNDWEVIDKEVITVAECTVQGGRIIDTSFDLDCSSEEKNIGCVDNCMNSLICCVEENLE